ncbi:putative porin [Ferruginibacter yonginensis]|uniref:Porin n=1 Tax=Ferruginibacter yonginensis TaxID=1310416 RepID=A0ABV8QUN5_9BACT
MKKILLSYLLIVCTVMAFGQLPGSRVGDILRSSGATRSQNNSRGSDTTKRKNNNKLDTLGFERRDDLKDSINITYRFLDSVRNVRIDSSVNNFDTYFPIPTHYQYLGNNGAAAFPLVFKPFAKEGWDAGFHAYDIYKFKLKETKFYKTTGPFSMLGYQLASGKEQMIQALHTQSPRPNMNFGFEYRLISAPGFFVTQNTNHNNVRLFGNYQGKRKRYNGAIVVISNVLKGAENGGIVDDASLKDPNKKERFSIPVNLGGALPYQPNPFQASVKTGNIYKDKTFFLRQSYDIGKRDSIAVNDSTTEYLFYPKLRLQHSLTINSQSYQFVDALGDSTLYKNWYNITFPTPVDTFELIEKWQSITNDFSLLQFPDTKNAAQFFLAGVSLQNLKATLRTGNYSFYNIMLHGEYRNRTRNKLWDVLLKGAYYVNGLNSGDYNVQAYLGRYLNKKLGDVKLYFNNVNRTPSFIFDNRSSFNLGNNNNYKKENITSFGATATNPYFTVGFNNYLIANYAYFKNYYQSEQYNKPINILQINASKKIKLKKNFYYYADVTLQQTDNAAPIKVPFVFTRSRIAYEGSLFKNLKLSTGLEVRYYTPYKANNYSPVIGQFTPQDTLTIKNRPDIAAFLHFRIKGFTGFLRAENLNTASFENGFGFINNNFAAPHYATQGLIIRFGIRWWFVN